MSITNSDIAKELFDSIENYNIQKIIYWEGSSKKDDISKKMEEYEKILFGTRNR